MASGAASRADRAPPNTPRHMASPFGFRQTVPVTGPVTAPVTNILAELRSGRPDALARLLPLVYDALRRAARRELASRPSDTLSTTGLVHELYLKLGRAQRPDWRDRTHFLGAAALAMRHLLVDRARRRATDKRGGAHRVVTLDEGIVADHQAASLLDLHDALDRLAAVDARLARVVECRFFGGLTEQETAELLGVTERTVRRDWTKARGFLYAALTAAEPSDVRGGGAFGGGPASVERAA